LLLDEGVRRNVRYQLLKCSNKFVTTVISFKKAKM
jgi:hypothetical protein